MKKVVVFLASALLLATPMMAAAATGIVGDCSDCHTMHNSQEGKPVALQGSLTTPDGTPNANLLKFDCIACHAMPGASTPTVAMDGGSVVPQVSQSSDDNLAGGNFRYSTENQRHGHNVKDLTAADGLNGAEGNPGVFNSPPGFYHASTHGNKFTADLNGGGAVFGAFTCAGARGCHGVRAQLLTGDTVDNGTANVFESTYRTGIAAISGAHHNSFDGLKDPAQNGTGVEDGSLVAAGYRFIPGLKGMGNTTDRWKNVDASSHNEYYGVAGGLQQTVATGAGSGTGCNYCHINGSTRGRMDVDSTLAVPNQSMSGFCSTCHGEFHSSGSTDLEGDGANGVSGAFLRHPSDFIIPDKGEYAAYTSYDITAPVARPDLSAITAGNTATVTPGTDMVMCLSCHEAHATPNDFMLRFAYTYDGSGDMQAGKYASITDAQAAGGCLACHTTKGVLPENRTP